MEDLAGLDGLALAELVRRGEVSSRELVERSIEAIEQLNPKLNAVVHRMYERARAEAEGELGEGAFAGVPMLLKDLGQTIAGVPTSHGSRFFSGWVAEESSELYLRFRRAGAIVVGKTNTPELGLAPVTESVRFGAARSPWDLARTPGGSSGGSAAAVAAGIVPIASGSDGGGSIRNPASCCGVFGLKPTRARTPAGPFASEHWAGFSVEHVITRSVRDSAAMLDAVSGPEVGAPYQVEPPGRPFLAEVDAEAGPLRIGFHHDPPFPATVHRDCIAAVRDAAALCESLGHRVEEVDPQHDRYRNAEAYVKVLGASIATEIAEHERMMGRAARPGEWEPATILGAMLGRAIRGDELMLAIRTLQAETRRLAHHLGGFDVLVTPTLAAPPPLVGSLAPSGPRAIGMKLLARSGVSSVAKLPGALEGAVREAFSLLPFTPVANFTGQPSMSVPLFWNGEGLPIGTLFTARFGDEAALFRLAAQLERARPWNARRPPVFAS